MNRQLALTLQLNDDVSFSDFCWEGNQPLKFHLEQILLDQGEHFIYIWGKQGSGKSCLLKASCNAMSKDHSAIYLPLETLKAMNPDIIAGVESQKLICIDDIEVIANMPEWEEAIFHLYNKVRENGQSILIISGKMPPPTITTSISRLTFQTCLGISHTTQ